MSSEPVKVALPLEDVHVVPADAAGDPIILSLKAGEEFAVQLKPQQAGNLALLLLDLVSRAPLDTDGVLMRDPTMAQDLVFEPGASPDHFVLSVDLGHVAARFIVSAEMFSEAVKQIRPIDGPAPRPN